MLLEEAGDRQCALVLLADPQVQRLHSAQQQVGRFRVERRPHDLAEGEDALDQLGWPAQDAAQRIGVAAEELGRAVEHEMRAQRQRILVEGRSEGVVDDHCRTHRATGP